MPYLSTETTPPAFVRRMLNAHTDACCAPNDAHSSMPQPVPVPRRARLSELDPNIHCSIIGTCLTTGELRKLVPRYALSLDRKTSSDLEIHHTAVELSTLGEAAAKELHKALDARHALALKRFKPAADETELAAMWGEALAHGDVPGAYWALLTHPLVTFELRRRAFGDVHMLSHLVGASNRADIRRLNALEEECARLKEHNAQQQAKLHELGAQHRQALDRLEQQAARLASLQERHAALGSASSDSEELVRVRAVLSSREEQLSLQATRYTGIEEQLETSQRVAGALRGEAELLRVDSEAMRAESHALEQTLTQALESGPGAAALPDLQGRCVVYVGGRRQVTTILAKLVADAGGELLVHDGGIEDRKGLIASMLPRAQLIVFPVDYISHNAMHVTKQLAARHGIACHPLRSASIASFVELIHRLVVTEQAST